MRETIELKAQLLEEKGSLNARGEGGGMGGEERFLDTSYIYKHSSWLARKQVTRCTELQDPCPQSVDNLVKRPPAAAAAAAISVLERHNGRFLGEIHPSKLCSHPMPQLPLDLEAALAGVENLNERSSEPALLTNFTQHGTTNMQGK